MKSTHPARIPSEVWNKFYIAKDRKEAIAEINKAKPGAPAVPLPERDWGYDVCLDNETQFIESMERAAAAWTQCLPCIDDEHKIKPMSASSTLPLLQGQCRGCLPKAKTSDIDPNNLRLISDASP